MSFYVGMDVGGTHARLKVANGLGETLYEAESAGGTISSSGHEVMRRRFEHLLVTALQKLKVRASDCCGLCLSAAGVDSRDLQLQYERILTDIGFPSEKIAVINDGELLLSVLPAPCIVLIAGTGSIALGKKNNGDIIRCGGWDFVLSDEGSAAAIGLEIMQAVLKNWDQQESCALLACLFSDATGFTCPEQVVNFFHENWRQKDRIAQLAPIAHKAAIGGDTCATWILSHASEQLFSLMTSIHNQLAPSQGPISTLFWGSVLEHNEIITDTLYRQIKLMDAPTRIYRLTFSALDVAVREAMGESLVGLTEEIKPKESGVSKIVNSIAEND